MATCTQAINGLPNGDETILTNGIWTWVARDLADTMGDGGEWFSNDERLFNANSEKYNVVPICDYVASNMDSGSISRYFIDERDAIDSFLESLDTVCQELEIKCPKLIDKCEAIEALENAGFVLIDKIDFKDLLQNHSVR